MRAKPFIKWVGGKGQLIEQLDAQLPADFGNWEDATYIEPFVGGGAMLFYMLQQYPNIRQAVINDVNFRLANISEKLKNFRKKLHDSTTSRIFAPMKRKIEEAYYADKQSPNR